MKDRIWLSLAHMGGREQEFIRDAFDTSRVVSLGPNVNVYLRWDRVGTDARAGRAREEKAGDS